MNERTPFFGMLIGEVNHMDYKMLHEKFERRKQWLVFEKEEVVRRLLVRYKAHIIPKTDIMDLVNDDQLSYPHIFCCITIDDPAVLEKIFNAKERADSKWERDDNARRGMVYKHKDEAHRRYNQLIIDEQEGRRLDIVLESQDGIYVTGFLTRDTSQEVVSYIYAHMGGAKYTGRIPRSMWPSDVTEEEIKDGYRRYLRALETFGKL
ncbi:hypothetical protein [Exiguobacterium sp. ZOR0005]|uniref:hypothetical protein n=1 Tax=Exiguobacterium sp. ZOR0005 TaxID=1339226 RepID=UPI000646C183|nr:hypothetical protein [Exiguobacterium sp. ZOR0005]